MDLKAVRNYLFDNTCLWH